MRIVRYGNTKRAAFKAVTFKKRLTYIARHFMAFHNGKFQQIGSFQNAAECNNLKFRGAIAPYYLADLVAVDNLKNFNAQYVIKNGKLVAENGKALFDTSKIKRRIFASVIYSALPRFCVDEPCLICTYIPFEIFSSISSL